MTTASSEMAFWAAQDSMAIEWPMIPMNGDLGPMKTYSGLSASKRV